MINQGQLKSPEHKGERACATAEMVKNITARLEMLDKLAAELTATAMLEILR